MIAARVVSEDWRYNVKVGDAYLCLDSDDVIVLAEPELGMPGIVYFASSYEAQLTADVYNLGVAEGVMHQ